MKRKVRKSHVNTIKIFLLYENIYQFISFYIRTFTVISPRRNVQCALLQQTAANIRLRSGVERHKLLHNGEVAAL